MAKPEPKAHSHPAGSLALEDRWHYLHLAIGLVAIVGAFCWLQFSTARLCCGDFDSYYHIKWSQILWTGLRHFNFPPRFEWLPLTTLSPTQYADQHFLFHVLLMPFTWFGDLRFGAKVATTLFGSAAVFSLYWLILRFRIRYPLLWLMALLGCGWVFYVRMNMTKAQSISIVFIVVGIVLLFERKYLWLAPAAFFYVWAYNLFVMLGVLALIWTGVVWWSERKFEWRPLVWTAVGMFAGLVVNPFFPRDIHLFIQHLVAKSGQVSVQSGVGFEWYALTSWYFLQSSLIACAAMVVGYMAFGYALAVARNAREQLQRPLALLIFSTFLLVIAMRSSRFMEYWPPLAVIFAAFALQSIWNIDAAGSDLSETGPREFASRQQDDEEDSDGADEAQFIPRHVLVIGLLLAAVAVYSLFMGRTKIMGLTVDPDHYQAGAEWMLANIPAGALIYDVNWTDFPKLFYYDTEHRYVSGLDPIYLAARHPELQTLNEELSSKSETDPAEAIRYLFRRASVSGVSYLFVGDSPAPVSAEWFRYITNGGKFTQVYADQHCVILHLLDSAQSSAPTNTAPADTAPANISAANTTPANTTPAAPAPVQGSTLKWNDPVRRKAAAEEVHRRFGGEIYGGDDEKAKDGPTLLINNKGADEKWARSVFDRDMNSPAMEFLWQIGFRTYLVTNGHDAWAIDIDEDPQYRSMFKDPPPPLQP
jgi:hypothetical protein